MTNKRHIGAVSLVVAIALVMGAHASAQEASETHVSGTFNDYVWVEESPGGGAWHVTGAWTANANAASGKGEFIGSLLGVRSDLWVQLTSADPANPALRTPHTHHIGLLDADVSVIPNGIRLEGIAIITVNGSVASVLKLDGSSRHHRRRPDPLLEHKTDVFGRAVDHFGPQPYDGLVVLER